MGHGKSNCNAENPSNQSQGENVYGPWLRVEADAYTVVKESYGLRRVEIPRGEIFDTFSKEVNICHEYRN